MVDGRASFSMRLIRGQNAAARCCADWSSLPDDARRPLPRAQRLPARLRRGRVRAQPRRRPRRHQARERDGRLVRRGLPGRLGRRLADPDAGGPTMPFSVSTERHTRSGVRGTPAFMAPEQAKGVLPAIGERTDVFGLGRVALLHPDRAPALRRRECERDPDPRARRAIPRIPSGPSAARGRRRCAASCARRWRARRTIATRSVLELQEDVRGFLNVGLHFPSRVFAARRRDRARRRSRRRGLHHHRRQLHGVEAGAGRAAGGPPPGAGRRLRRDRDPVAHGAHRHRGRDRRGDRQDRDAGR